jgi:hypothetical protein
VNVLSKFLSSEPRQNLSRIDWVCISLTEHIHLFLSSEPRQNLSRLNWVSISLTEHVHLFPFCEHLTVDRDRIYLDLTGRCIRQLSLLNNLFVIPKWFHVFMQDCTTSLYNIEHFYSFNNTQLFNLIKILNLCNILLWSPFLCFLYLFFINSSWVLVYDNLLWIRSAGWRDV